MKKKINSFRSNRIYFEKMRLDEVSSTNEEKEQDDNLKYLNKSCLIILVVGFIANTGICKFYGLSKVARQVSRDFNLCVLLGNGWGGGVSPKYRTYIILLSY
jgi:hypothetical protein